MSLAYLDTGYKWVDYASTLGRFAGTDWERDAFWCWEDSQELH